MRTIDLDMKADLFGALRQLVEEGAEDGPVRVMRAGRPSVEVRSLHRGALMTVAESPSPRIVAWSPYPGAAVGPRVIALLEARAAKPEETEDVFA